MVYYVYVIVICDAMCVRDIYIYIFQAGLKSSYDSVITTVDFFFFFTNGIQTLGHRQKIFVDHICCKYFG